MVMPIKTCSEHVALIHFGLSINYVEAWKQFLKEKITDMSSQFQDANSTEYNNTSSQFHDANQQNVTKKSIRVYND